MKLRDTVIQEGDAARIQEILTRFLGDSGAGEALLIDRGGQLLAMDGVSRTLGTVLGEARARPKPAGEFAAPLSPSEARPAWTPPA